MSSNNMQKNTYTTKSGKVRTLTMVKNKEHETVVAQIRENQQNPIEVPPPGPSSVSRRVHLHYSPPPPPQPQQPRGNLSPKAYWASQFFTNPCRVDKRNEYSKEASAILKPHFTAVPLDKQNIISDIQKNPRVTQTHLASMGVLMEEDVPKDTLLYEMRGELVTRNERNVKMDLRLKIVVEELPLYFLWSGDVDTFLRRSCQPNCRLTYFFGTELHLFLTSDKALKRDEMVTLPMEPDWIESDTELRCELHEKNPAMCPAEIQRLQRMAEKERGVVRVPLPETPLDKALLVEPIIQLDDSDEEIDASTSGNQGDVDEQRRAMSPLNNAATSSTSSNIGVRMPRVEQMAADEPSAAWQRGVAHGEAQRRAAANARRNRASTNGISSRNDEAPAPKKVARGLQLPTNAASPATRFSENVAMKKIVTTKKTSEGLQYACKMGDGSERRVPNSVLYKKNPKEAFKFLAQFTSVRMKEGESRSAGNY